MRGFKVAFTKAMDAADAEGQQLIQQYGVMESDKKLWGSSEHVYKNVDKICSLSKCKPSDVHDLDKIFPAPGADGKSKIKMGGISDVDLPGPVAIFNGTDHVLHYVDDETMTIFNFTLGDHVLNPGWVMRQTFVKDGDVYIGTYGAGSGFNLFNVNGNQGMVDYVWSGPNDKIRGCIEKSNC